MKIRYSLLVIFAALVGIAIGSKFGHAIGFKDGWMACSTDSLAIENFHRAANALPDDDDVNDLENIWMRCQQQAAMEESGWNNVSAYRKLKYPIRSFWKSNNGLPRRISRSQREQFVEALKQ